MRKNELRARSAVKRDLAAVALPTKLQLQKIITELQNLVYSALKTGEVADIESVCRERLLALLNAGTEVAVLKGGRRGQLSSEKVIDEPIQEIMPVRFSLKDSGTVQAKGTADYLRRISGIDPTRTNNEFWKQNAVLIDGLSKEICDTVRKTIVDLTKLGVHVRGGKKEISDILLNAGLDPAAAPRLAETIFRTQTAAAYNAGRWNIVNDSDTAPYIWGFQYCTVRDRRVRPEHRLLEGVRLPKDDPFWKRYLPPNGWNCRCTVLEIWKDEDIASVDFGITGVDPRKRSPEELNLHPEFDGNAGILEHKEKNPDIINVNQQNLYFFAPREVSDAIKKINIGTKVEEKIRARFVVKIDGDKLLIKDENNKTIGKIYGSEVALSKHKKRIKVKIGEYQEKECEGVFEALDEARNEICKTLHINPEEVLFYFQKFGIFNVIANSVDEEVQKVLDSHYNTSNGKAVRFERTQGQLDNCRDEIDEYSKNHKISHEEYIKKCNEKLENIFKDTAVFVRVKYSSAVKIAKDKRFKTLFEVCHSNGDMNRNKRSEMESRIFGYAKFNGSTKGQSFRPVYGFIAKKSKLNKSLQTTAQYGMILFQLKDSVKGRTTWTELDSLRKCTRFNTGISFVDNPTILSMGYKKGYYDDSGCFVETDRLKDVLSPNVKSLDDIKYNNDEYIEAQIHGGVTIKDIEKIFICKKTLHDIDTGQTEESIKRQIMNHFPDIPCEIIR